MAYNRLKHNDLRKRTKCPDNVFRHLRTLSSPFRGRVSDVWRVKDLQLRWRPSVCQNCGAAYQPTWETDYTLGGELVYKCAQCGCWVYPPIRGAS